MKGGFERGKRRWSALDPYSSVDHRCRRCLIPLRRKSTMGPDRWRIITYDHVRQPQRAHVAEPEPLMGYLTEGD